MKRPIVIRHVLSHVSRRCVTPFRLRTVDADRLAKYIEHLEANQRSTGAGGSTITVRLHADMSVSLEPEERVLGGLLAAAADAAGLNDQPGPCCTHPDCESAAGHGGPCRSASPPLPGTHADDCSLHPGHTGACVAFLSA